MALTDSVLSLIQHLNKTSYENKINPNTNKLQRLTLKNGLEVLLIQNPSFEDSEVMLTVDAGSIYDPYKIPGLAHLVEHLIFSGSEKYNSNSHWSNFQNKNGGKLDGQTFLEKMTFISQIPDEHFMESLDYLLCSITEPLFTQEDCLREIELIEHEWKIKNCDKSKNFITLANFLTDEIFQENRFTFGNIKTLKITGIEKEVKKFHSTYFKANRMQLVIKSKFRIEHLEKMAQRFDCVPAELENQYIPNLRKKTKMNENGNDSLLNLPVDIKFKESCRGKIIKYNDIKNSFLANFYFIFPSLLGGFNPIHFEYLKESISQQLERLLYTNSFIKDIKMNQDNFRRKNVFNIVLELTGEDSDKLNSVISTIYEYFNRLKPDQNLFNQVKRNMIAKSQQYITESEILQTYSDYIFLYNTPKLGEFELKAKYDEKVFKDLIRRLSDIKNWTVFVSTNDNNLPNTVPNYECSFGNPIPIKIDLKAQNFVKHYKFHDYKPISKLETNLKKDRVNSLEIEPKTIHLKMKHGEYNLVQKENIFGEYCEILLSFISPSDGQKNYSNDLFNYFILNKINALCEENAIDVSIRVEKIHLFENNLHFKIKKAQITEFLEILSYQLKNYELSDSEIIEAKKIEFSNFKSSGGTYKKSNLLEFSKKFLAILIKKKKIMFKQKYNGPVKFNENYYLVITAIGNITETEVLQIYEKLKSTGSKENCKNLALKDINLKTVDNNSPDNLLTMAYHVSADTKLKEFALVNLLKVIFKTYTFELLHCKNGYSYSHKVKFTYFRQQAFVVFSIRTLKETNLVKDEIKNMMKNYLDILKEISENNDLESFKKTACRKMRWKIESFSNLFNYVHLNSLIGIYHDDLQTVAKQAINSITIEDLKNLQDKFTVEPIVIHGLNKISESD